MLMAVSCINPGMPPKSPNGALELRVLSFNFGVKAEVIK
jgi:hypothetical protein